MNSTIADGRKPVGLRCHRQQVVGFITYQRTIATLSLLRTETDTRLAGQACGEALVRRVLDMARVVTALSGLSLLTTSLTKRFGILDGGITSARDATYTVLPQRERLAGRAGSDETVPQRPSRGPAAAGL